MATNAQLARLSVLAVALLLLLPVVTMVLAWPLMGMGWWMHGPVAADGPVGPGGATPTWVMGGWLLGLVVLAGVGYLLYRGVSGSVSDPALAELRRAYARGDLTDEEFEERRQRLRE